jgi:hypothetical protein
MSAVAAVGGAVVTAGLRRALGQAPMSPAGRTASGAAIGGYLIHEVHVIHHVVHHVIGPAAD